ncbi:MAG: nucleotidyltransferase domain-containing protein [Nanoarchaeota archaeon]|nr:nucleotidyltransferase domain-containing protein [Nanoarchaeota archaeon]MBU1622286.1 nucleotidyltransferase domain-containing protein [Nanoarchaeota archaeon]
MLTIINNLAPFFEDCYRRINVREYGKIRNMSPPTASKLLNSFYKEGLLNKEIERNYYFFTANKISQSFIDLSHFYWREQLVKLTDFLNQKLTSPAIVLFGSLAKAEAKQDSDFDLAIFAHKKQVDLKKFEKELGRTIQLFWFPSLNSIKAKELATNIINGYTLNGRLKL